MTEKQIIFKNYLLKRLGFKDDSFIRDYIYSLTEIVSIHRGIASIDIKDWDEKSPKPYYFYDDENERYLPEYFSLIDFLYWEYKLKKEKGFQKTSNQSNYVSATDLANFTYCPVAYSISRTFKTPKNQLGEFGTKKHEEHRLIQYLKNTRPKTEEIRDKDVGKKDIYTSFSNEKTKDFFDDIIDSELIFSGHNENKDNEKFFINSEMNFIGQPDYILKNCNGQYYVIEEKFKRSKFSNQNYFFRNHKVQIASYIYYLNRYKIDYGYLVYWLYDYNNYQYNIEQCNILKINRSNSIELFLKSAFKSVNTFNEKKFCNIDINGLNPNKCANCVYIIICGHKNKRRNQVSLPYQDSYLNLYSTPYPEELKK
jgi:CRISPR/Cas system-associated exonuclease Cas4 (RecB family)